MSGAWSSVLLSDEIYTAARIDGSGSQYVYAPAVTGTIVSEFDFTVNDGGWLSGTRNPGAGYTGTYFAGSGWGKNSGASGFEIEFALPIGTEITRLEIDQVMTGAGAGTPAGWAWFDHVASSMTASAILQVNTRDKVGTFSYGDNVTYTIAHGRLSIIIDKESTWTLRITRIAIYTDVAGSALCRKSTDNGASFPVVTVVGDSPGSDAGFSVAPIYNGNVYAGIADAVAKSTDGGATFAPDANGACSGSYPAAIYAYKTGYVFASAAAVAGESMWKVEGSQVDITPTFSASPGLPVSQHCIVVDVRNPDNIYAVLSFAGNVRFCKSTDGGSSWSTSAPFSNSALSIDLNVWSGTQLIVADAGVIWYSSNSGTTWVAKQAPSTSTIAAFFRR